MFCSSVISLSLLLKYIFFWLSRHIIIKIMIIIICSVDTVPILYIEYLISLIEELCV